MTLFSRIEESLLTRNSWYGIATKEDHIACLSKLNFSSNEVVNSTYYVDDDGITLESNDLIYSVETDLSLSIDDHNTYYYRSHNQNEFITDEAHFFKYYSDAMDFADLSNTDCRLSVPE